jgi:hypothetical protein
MSSQSAVQEATPEAMSADATKQQGQSNAGKIQKDGKSFS